MIPNCKKCMHKCHAECCAWVDLDLKWVEKHKDKIQRDVYGYVDSLPGKVKFITNVKQDAEGRIDNRKQICPFLTADFKCAVYNDRPFVCRVFGTDMREDHPFTCHYHLGKNYHFPLNRTKQETMIAIAKYYNELTKKYPNLLNEL